MNDIDIEQSVEPSPSMVKISYSGDKKKVIFDLLVFHFFLQENG